MGLTMIGVGGSVDGCGCENVRRTFWWIWWIFFEDKKNHHSLQIFSQICWTPLIVSIQAALMMAVGVRMLEAFIVLWMVMVIYLSSSFFLMIGVFFLVPSFWWLVRLDNGDAWPSLWVNCQVHLALLCFVRGGAGQVGSGQKFRKNILCLYLNLYSIV